MTDDTDAFGAQPLAPPPPPLPPPPVLPPAGWYPDPGGGPGPRWWDGRDWHGASAAAGGGGSGGTDGLAIAAFVFSLLGGAIVGAILAVVALRRIKRRRNAGRPVGGRGLAIAALWINAVIVVLFVGGVVAALTGAFDVTNADRYTGRTRDIALVIDRFEDAADSSAAEECALLTPKLQDVMAGDKGSCAEGVGENDGIQVDIEATSIVVIGTDSATAEVVEDGETLEMRFVREPDGWRISGIGTSP